MPLVFGAFTRKCLLYRTLKSLTANKEKIKAAEIYRQGQKKGEKDKICFRGQGVKEMLHSEGKG